MRGDGGRTLFIARRKPRQRAVLPVRTYWLICIPSVRMAGCTSGCAVPNPNTVVFFFSFCSAARSLRSPTRPLSFGGSAATSASLGMTLGMGTWLLVE